MTDKTQKNPLTEKIMQALTLDEKTGVGIPADKLYESVLPAELPMETVLAVQNHNASFVAGSVEAFGTLSVNAMASNKSLDKTTVEIPMAGKDSVGINVDRTKTYANNLGDGKPVVKHGVVTATYTVDGGRNSASLKAARASITDLAMGKLAGG